MTREEKLEALRRDEEEKRSDYLIYSNDDCLGSRYSYDREQELREAWFKAEEAREAFEKGE